MSFHKFSLLILLSVSQAFAVTISGERCVAASNEDVIQAITDYGSYSKIPESKYSLQGLHMLDLADSQVIVAKNYDDAFVRFELIPLNLTDRSLYPHFMIRCQIARESESKATYSCHWLTDADMAEYYGHSVPIPTAFGLSDFHSKLEINSSSGACTQGQTHLSYQIEIQPSEADVDKIKQNWASSFHHELGALIGGFPIPENLFFQNYYEGFYKGWASRIERK